MKTPTGLVCVALAAGFLTLAKSAMRTGIQRDGAPPVTLRARDSRPQIEISDLKNREERRLTETNGKGNSHLALFDPILEPKFRSTERPSINQRQAATNPFVTNQEYDQPHTSTLAIADFDRTDVVQAASEILGSPDVSSVATADQDTDDLDEVEDIFDSPKIVTSDIPKVDVVEDIEDSVAKDQKNSSGASAADLPVNSRANNAIASELATHQVESIEPSAESTAHQSTSKKQKSAQVVGGADDSALDIFDDVTSPTAPVEGVASPAPKVQDLAMEPGSFDILDSKQETKSGPNHAANVSTSDKRDTPTFVNDDAVSKGQHGTSGIETSLNLTINELDTDAIRDSKPTPAIIRSTESGSDTKGKLANDNLSKKNQATNSVVKKTIASNPQPVVVTDQPRNPHVVVPTATPLSGTVVSIPEKPYSAPIGAAGGLQRSSYITRDTYQQRSAISSANFRPANLPPANLTPTNYGGNNGSRTKFGQTRWRRN